MSNRVAAQAGAENEEREKVAKGESVGGPKILSYSWREEVAQEGDMKVYGLRFGSTDNAFSMDPFVQNKSKDGLVTYVELSLLANISQNELVENENYLLKGLWNFGGRFGGINSNDSSRADSKEKSLSAAYFYLPLTYQLKFQSSFNLEFWAEYGGDVITLLRHYISKAEKKIPLYVYVGAGVGYRIGGVATIGVKMERYSGSLVTGWGEPTINPTYTHELTSAFVALGF